MIRNGRPPVDLFHGNEHLYLRYGRQNWVDGQLDLTGIKLDKTSVNRGSFSEPEDVLYSVANKYEHMGVVRFSVGEIPSPVSKPPAPASVFWPVHDPLEENYSHSEIWSKKDGVEEDYSKPTAAIRTEFRIRLARVLTEDRICIRATDPAGQA